MFWTLPFLLNLYHLLIPPFYFSICPIPLDASNIKMLSISIPWHLKKISGNCFTFSPINRQICSKKYHHFPSHPLPMHACMCSFISDSLLPHGLEPTKLFCPWDFPGKNTGVGFHLLLPETFPTQESKRNSSPMSPSLQTDSLPQNHWRCPPTLHSHFNLATFWPIKHALVMSFTSIFWI